MRYELEKKDRVKFERLKDIAEDKLKEVKNQMIALQKFKSCYEMGAGEFNYDKINMVNKNKLIDKSNGLSNIVKDSDYKDRNKSDEMTDSINRVMNELEYEIIELELKIEEYKRIVSGLSNNL